jgi:hypothetical protein
MKSLISVVAQSNSLIFNWEDNSGCAPQLTSFNFKIFQVKKIFTWSLGCEFIAQLYLLLV